MKALMRKNMDVKVDTNFKDLEGQKQKRMEKHFFYLVMS
jgi:hypothetical protein